MFLPAGKFSCILYTLDVRLRFSCYFNDRTCIKLIHAMYLKCLLHPIENSVSKEMIKCSALCKSLIKKHITKVCSK